MLISITTVCFNSAATLARTIESVLNQTYSNIEYIIKDGGSTDNTVIIARSYAKKFEAKGYRFVIISEKDAGMYDAINQAVLQCKGEIVGNINSDDYYEPDAVETMVVEYKKTNFDVAWGNIKVKTPRATFIKKANLGKYFWTTTGFCHPAMFAKRSVLLEHPYAKECMADDFEFATWAHVNGKKIVTVDHLISVFEFGGMSTKKTWADVMKRVNMVYGIYKKYGMSRLYWLQRMAYESVKYVFS